MGGESQPTDEEPSFQVPARGESGKPDEEQQSMAHHFAARRTYPTDDLGATEQDSPYLSVPRVHKQKDQATVVPESSSVNDGALPTLRDAMPAGTFAGGISAEEFDRQFPHDPPAEVVDTVERPGVGRVRVLPRQLIELLAGSNQAGDEQASSPHKTDSN